MNEKEQEWKNEQQRVDQVVGKMKERIVALENQMGGVKSDIVNIRKNFWEDVTVNVDNLKEAVETYASIKQKAEMLSERERSHQHAQKELKTLKRLTQSPYFGRIDFLEEGEQETENIYLGIGSFFDEETEQFLIYDWRAPISSLYYDYSIGPAQYEAPGGTVFGEMKLKRQFIIRNGKMKSMFDTGITIGDELLQEVLGNHSNTQMKSIVATIQKEQNRVIRNETSRLLIVQGAAGSGKTSAALQRVAYLLYRYRETLHADQIVLFSPNPLFNSYVSTVLPELGEENMQQTTFQQYLNYQLGETFHLEDAFTQMEYILTSKNQPDYAVRVEGIQYKATFDFMGLIERYSVFLKHEGMIFKDITFRGKTLVSAEQIRNRFYAMDSSWAIPNRMKLIMEWLMKELKEHERLERDQSWAEEEAELLDKEVYMKIHHKLQRKKRYSENTFDDFEREQKMLAAMVVKKRFKPLYQSVKRLKFIDMPAVYHQLFADPQFVLQFTEQDSLPQCWAGICAQTAEVLERGELAYEDGTPYLYLKEQIEGFQKNTSVRHVFIDEAQDYSPFQFAFLKRLFPNSKMTVLGDLNQTIHAHAVQNSVSALTSLYGTDKSEAIVLTRSYRSTRPIIEFTRQIIYEREAIEPFNRKGDKPVVIHAAEEELAVKVLKQIETLQEKGHKTVAVICKTAEESQKVYNALHKSIQLRLIHKETAAFEQGVLVIPSYLAKGMEFDAVIVYNASKEQYGEESERKLFYTVCTRAMHELVIFFTGEMSPFISGVSSDTYVIEN